MSWKEEYAGTVFGRDEPDCLILAYDHFIIDGSFFEEFERRYKSNRLYYNFVHDIPEFMYQYKGHTIKIDKTDDYVLEDHINERFRRYDHDIYHTMYIAKDGYWWTVGRDAIMIKTNIPFLTLPM